MLDILFLGLKASPVTWTSFIDEKISIFLSAVHFFQFLVIKTLELDPDRYLTKNAGSRSGKLNPDPKHFLLLQFAV